MGVTRGSVANNSGFSYWNSGVIGYGQGSEALSLCLRFWPATHWGLLKPVGSLLESAQVDEFLPTTPW